MKVLILSCNTGGGHNAAAQAIAEAIREHGDCAEVLDYLSLAEMEYRNWSGMVM